MTTRLPLQLKPAPARQADPYLFDRQKRLLVLLDALGGDVGTTDFQKLLFLYSNSCKSPPYEFVPYRFGAFSFTSYAERQKLTTQGLLVADPNMWTLTAKGRTLSKALRFEGRDDIVGFVQHVGDLRGDALVAETYRRYPYTAIHSEITGKVLNGDAIAFQRIDDARGKASVPGVATIGYEGRSLEGYLNTLIQNGVTVLCDVRKNPVSRRYGFAKKTLATACSRVAIRYEHLPQFGVESADRKNLQTQRDYDTLFESYVACTLPERGPDLATILRWVEAGDRVALTCYEREPHLCHRHCVSDALERHLDLQVVHL